MLFNILLNARSTNGGSTSIGKRPAELRICLYKQPRQQWRLQTIWGLKNSNHSVFAWTAVTLGSLSVGLRHSAESRRRSWSKEKETHRLKEETVQDNQVLQCWRCRNPWQKGHSNNDMWWSTGDNMANNQIHYIPAFKSVIPCWFCKTASRSSHKYLFSCLVNWDQPNSYLTWCKPNPSRGKNWLNLKTWQIWFPDYKETNRHRYCWFTTSDNQL